LLLYSTTDWLRFVSQFSKIKVMMMMMMMYVCLASEISFIHKFTVLPGY